MSMMNSMNDLLEELKKLFGNFEVQEIDEREVKIDVESDKVVGILTTLKSKGYSHLSLLTCVDWINENKFELIYILYSWQNGCKFIVATWIERKNPKFVTVMNLWPVARFYEREIHEFFGVEFEGNDDMKPLILELWDDIPPLRKDFDPLEYSKKKFPGRQYDKDLIQEALIFRGDKNG
jgi:NADH-quinone oxidoreductase subunit C